MEVEVSPVATIICRPELHGATTREQYAEFHSGMNDLGLARTITQDGKVFHLPTGEYAGVNVSDSFRLLALKIDALAMRVSGNRCKLTLERVNSPADVFTYNLDEETSYASALAALFSSSPSQPISPLAALAGSQHLPPVPTGIPVSLEYGFLAGMKKG
jgi:hypothetical protein